MNLTFYGGAKSVTGSNYVLESEGPASAGATAGKKKIMVDCGMQQGGHFAEKKNFEPFPYEPSEIEAVFVTHAHIDHIGLLPKLVKGGFKGKVYSTPATRDFAELMLIDSEHLLGKEAEREGKPPLYNTEDVEKLMKVWEGVEYHSPINVSVFNIELFDEMLTILDNPFMLTVLYARLLDSALTAYRILKTIIILFLLFFNNLHLYLH